MPILLSRRPSSITTLFRASRYPSFHQTATMSSSHPPWLTSLLNDTSPAPRIYRWTPNTRQPPDSPPRDPRRIFILGVGNIGRLYAVHLTRHRPNPPPITLVLHRRDLLDHWIANPGIEITCDGGKIVKKTVDGLDVEYWTDDPQPADEGSSSEIGPLISNIIIATKADAALPQADRLRRYLGPSSTVAFAQNGISKMWPPHGRLYASHRWPAGDAPSFAACITTHGVLSHGPFRSEHASVTDAKIGLVMPSPMCPRGSEYLLDTVAAAPGLESRRVSRADMWVLQLEKLVVNSIINPITAILRCKNGVLFAVPSGALVEVMDRVLHETSRVYQALVNHPSTAEILMDPDSPGHFTLGTETKSLDAIRKDLTGRFAVGPLRAMLWRVGHQVSLNTSSMLQDVRAGRRTEIREFNGWIVDTAHFLGARTSTDNTPSTNSSTDPARCQAGQQQQGLDVSTHRALIDLVESGRTLDQSELGKAISG